MLVMILSGPQLPSGLVGLASNHRMQPVCGSVQVPQVTKLKICSNVTLAFEQYVKPQF